MEVDPNVGRRLDRIDWRLEVLELLFEARGKRMDKIESELLTERDARVLNDGIKREIRLRSGLQLTRFQQIVAMLVAGVAFADMVIGLVR